MAQGTVKWFNTQKGYGFINPDEEGNDVFVHITAVQNSGLTGLNEGQQVTYELEEQRNGKMAAVRSRDCRVNPARGLKIFTNYLLSVSSSRTLDCMGPETGTSATLNCSIAFTEILLSSRCEFAAPLRSC